MKIVAALAFAQVVSSQVVHKEMDAAFPVVNACQDLVRSEGLKLMVTEFMYRSPADRATDNLSIQNYKNSLEMCDLSLSIIERQTRIYDMLKEALGYTIEESEKEAMREAIRKELMEKFKKPAQPERK